MAAPTELTTMPLCSCSILTESGSEDYICDDQNLAENFSLLGNIAWEYSSRRKICEKCRRASKVCWCSYLPCPRIKVKSQLYVLQHPYEDTRSLKTAVMLLHGLQPGKCSILKGKRFHQDRSPLKDILHEPNTVLLYPSSDSMELSQLSGLGFDHYNLIMLDGTWPQAKALYAQNSFLKKLKKVKLTGSDISKYVIRTQPTNDCLSTVESGATALAVLEDRPEIKEQLERPLQALCQFQLNHGAVVHQSKQYLVENGLYRKQDHARTQPITDR